jgi:lipid A 3-O-deacylase
MKTSLLKTLIAACLLPLTGAGAAQAESLFYDMKVGGLYHDVPGLWSGFQLEKKSLDINIEAQLSPSMQVWFFTMRPAFGGTINTEGLTSHAYADARLSYEWPSGVFFGFGVGAAIHDGHIGIDDPYRKAMGSRVLFHAPLELGYRFDAHNSISGYFEHISNGYTQRYNEGMDRAGIRYGYRF